MVLMEVGNQQFDLSLFTIQQFPSMKVQSWDAYKYYEIMIWKNGNNTYRTNTCEV